MLRRQPAPRRAARFTAILLMAPVAAMLCLTTLRAELPASQPAHDDAHIVGLIQRLADPAEPSRLAARRELLVLGPPAVAALQRAAGSDNPSVAAPARELLDTFADLMFFGADVELTFDPPEAAWDQPVTLGVTIRCEGPLPCRTPFMRDPPDETPEARQVAALHEIADFLVVFGPDGRQIDTLTDPVNDDHRIWRAVARRADAYDEIRLQPGQSRTFLIGEFNRGWSRFPMLARGEYSAQVAYLPDWDDDELIERSAGIVMSNTATLRITRPAPDYVGRHDRPMLGRLRREGDSFIAEVINTYDRPRWFNLNWGGGGLQYAELMFIAEWTPRNGEVESAAGAWTLADWRPPPVAEFSQQRLRLLAPGQRIELLRVPVAELCRTREPAPPREGEVRWKFRYVSWLTRGIILAGGFDNAPLSAAARAEIEKTPVGVYEGIFDSNLLALPATIPDPAPSKLR